jgi:hypothetical protein
MRKGRRKGRMRWDLGQDTGKKGMTLDRGVRRWMWAPTPGGWGTPVPDPRELPLDRSQSC